MVLNSLVTLSAPAQPVIPASHRYRQGCHTLRYRIISQGNLAQGKPAAHSSQKDGFHAGLANDGNLNTFSHTRDQGEPYPWWRVDLQDNINVGYVNVVARRDCCWDRLASYLITVGNSENPTHNPVCPGTNSN